MPFYIYRCPDCGKTKEVHHRITKVPEVYELVCEKCKRIMRRVLSQNSFMMKPMGKT